MLHKKLNNKKAIVVITVVIYVYDMNSGIVTKLDLQANINDIKTEMENGNFEIFVLLR